MAEDKKSLSTILSESLNFEVPDCDLPSIKTRVLRDFTITTDSYISLCSRVYAATCCKHSDFANHISESAFQYYAILILWKRFAQILPSSAERKSEFFSEISKIGSPSIPIPLLTYLKGIGHFSEPDSSDRRFLLPLIPLDEKVGGIRYTFGKVNAKTHYLYEAFPAPAIAVLRMLADFEYTTNPSEENFVWDLPQALGADSLESQVKCSKPTRNLLGWAPAQTLSKNQLELFRTLKIDAKLLRNDFTITCEPFKELFNKIHKYFNDWDKSETKVTGAAPLGELSSMGSVVQGLTIERHHELPKFDRSAMYCDGSLSVCSPYKSDDEVNKAAVICGYRMAKEPIGNRHSWSCYDYDSYRLVPESWIRSRNTIYTYGSVGRLNESVFNTGYVNKKFMQNQSIYNTMFELNSKWDFYK